MSWVDIQGYEGRYQVSSDGEIRALYNYRRSTPLPRLINCIADTRGYKMVWLYPEGGSRKPYRVHHLVAFYFIGPRPQGYHINHINGIKQDNRAENLEYVTPSENAKHSFVAGLQCNKGESHSQNKLTNDDIKSIKDLYYIDKWSQKQISKLYNVDSSQISRIVRGLAWSHVIV